MCGIVGMIGLNGRSAIPLVIDKMADVVKHRGPDSYGSFSSGPVGLGFRRLAIIDLSRDADQPMKDEDGSLIIVFNGEIFNYIELREELRGLGHAFRTNSDTEVLLKAYRQWGDDCLEKLNGMWAFLIYDTKEHKIFASRDRFGIKPLHIYENDDYILFGSEIKSIIASGLYKGGINWKVSADFLIRGELDNTDETFYDGINKLGAGHALEIRLNGAKKEWKYWSIDDTKEKDTKDIPERFFELFEDSVRLRLRSDVPVGVSLSGGLDSTAIICSVKRLRDKNGSREGLEAFSYIAKEFDESEYINETIKYTEARLNKVEMETGDYIQKVRDLLWYHDEPVHSINQLVVYDLYRLAASRGMKVMLVGQGADETMGGYTDYFDFYWYTLLRRGNFVQAWQEIKGFCKIHGGSAIDTYRRIMRLAFRSELGKINYYRKMARYRQLMTKKMHPWFTSDFSNNLIKENTEYVDNSLNKLLKRSVETKPLPLYLRLDDRNSMASSIESRVPFMDYRLISFLFTVPIEYKMSGPWNKYILRKSMEGKMPDNVRNRYDKMGFPVPRKRWLSDTLYGPVKDILSSEKTRKRGIYCPDKIMGDFDRHRKGEIDISEEIFHVLEFEFFCNMLSDRINQWAQS